MILIITILKGKLEKQKVFHHFWFLEHTKIHEIQICIFMSHVTWDKLLQSNLSNRNTSNCNFSNCNLSKCNTNLITSHNATIFCSKPLKLLTRLLWSSYHCPLKPSLAMGTKVDKMTGLRCIYFRVFDWCASAVLCQAEWV
jgi:hypothetical protein